MFFLASLRVELWTFPLICALGRLLVVAITAFIITMLRLRHQILIVGILSILIYHVLVVEAGWRPSVNSRWAPTTNQSTTQNRHQQQIISPLHLPSLFGLVNSEVAIRRSFLASIVTASIRGGGNSDEDEDVQGNAEEEIQVTPVNSKDKQRQNRKGKDDNDDERYSRQMYALGARAHKLIRSTTAILDGPLGGKERFTTANNNVRIEGADGFEGIDNDPNANEETHATSQSETPSGLLYEIAKNLALSGVGRIILVQDDEDGPIADGGYFDGSLDDLGAAYHRAALAEISDKSPQDNRGSSSEAEEGDSDIDEDEFASLNDGAILLEEYIQRLNPGVQVDIITRSMLFDLLHSSEDVEENDASDDAQDNISLGANPVVVCVDRSITSQIEMNDACRDQECSSSSSQPPRIVPFISVETAGVHARLFCDFGPNFVVVDEDGENPRSILLDRVEEGPNDENAVGETSYKQFTVHCLEDERHDVSKGDVIEFQGKHDDNPLSGKASFPKCQVVSVKSPRCIVVKEWDGEPINQDGQPTDSSLSSLLEGKARSFTRVKLPKEVSFSPLREIIQPSAPDEEESLATIHSCCDVDTLFAPSDLDKSFDPLRRRAVMTSMAVLDAFVKKYGRLPSRFPKSSHKRTDMDRFQSLVQKMAKDNEDDSSSTNQKQWDLLITQFAQTCRAKFTPVQALSGALGAQEVLKAATGLYNPVRQFLLYDCDEVLQQSDEDEGDAEENNECNTVAPGQSYILGDRISNKLADSRLFLVGAGAIGCELLKNLAAMGAGTGTKQGCLILTDMDTIEKSNLSRQLLFRDHDVGQFKSVAARAAMLRFSPTCRIEAHTSRVGEEEDGPFNDDFWSSGCNVVLNALDNVEARLFVDSQCVAHGLGLLDAGTLGPKGNVQVVVPHESESYGSSADPPEPDIPVCTLKNFPYEISHTIQWARDLFDGYFYRRPRQANDHVDEMAHSEDLTTFGETLIEKLGDDAALDMATELGEDLGFYSMNWDSSDPDYLLAVRRDSLIWAIMQAHQLFYVAMDELIQKHPIDSVDDDGSPFWTGTRRVPKPLRFVPLDSEEDEVSAQQVIINERIAQFVGAAARLRLESLLPTDGGRGEASSISLDEALIALQEQAKLLYKKKKPKEILHNLSGGGGSDDDDTLSLIVDKLKGAKTGASFLPQLNLADFEKDDESNGHVAFVTAASNLRAMAYGIPPADLFETRRVAGQIVPAMITTTGLVSALSCLELVKLLKGLPLTLHRNAFVNLALPFFAFTSPMPAEEVWGVNGKTHTIWDRITVKGKREMTLDKFLRKIQKKAGCEDGVEVSSISYGPFMIYANFLHSHDEELLESPLLNIVKDAVISEDDDGDEEEKKASVGDLTDEQKAILSKLEHKRFIDFSVAVEDPESGEEYELPPVRLIKDRTKKDTMS